MWRPWTDGRTAELAALEAADSFVARHIGPSEADIAAMLHAVGAATLNDLAAKTVPPAIRTNQTLDLPPPIDEAAVIAELRGLAAQEHAEEVADRHGLPRHSHAAGDPAQRAGEPWLVHCLHAVSGGDRAGPAGGAAQLPDDDLRADGDGDRQASLLDEATAAAEAMAMAHAVSKTKSDVLAVATDVHPQTRAVLATRARPIGISAGRCRAWRFGGDRRGAAIRAGAAISRHHRRGARAVAGDQRRA